MAKIAAGRLRPTLDALAQAALQSMERKQQMLPEHHDLLASALLDAWSIVDMCHRVRELVQQLPGFSAKKNSIVKAFIENGGAIERLRHYFQHFRNEINAIPDSTPPLLGGLSWVATFDPQRVFTAFSGAMLSNITVETISYNTVNRRFNSECILKASNCELNVFKSFEEMEKVKAELEQWVAAIPAIQHCMTPWVMVWETVFFEYKPSLPPSI